MFITEFLAILNQQISLIFHHCTSLECFQELHFCICHTTLWLNNAKHFLTKPTMTRKAIYFFETSRVLGFTPISVPLRSLLLRVFRESLILRFNILKFLLGNHCKIKHLTRDVVSSIMIARFPDCYVNEKKWFRFSSEF